MKSIAQFASSSEALAATGLSTISTLSATNMHERIRGDSILRQLAANGWISSITPTVLKSGRYGAKLGGNNLRMTKGTVSVTQVGHERVVITKGGQVLMKPRARFSNRQEWYLSDLGENVVATIESL